MKIINAFIIMSVIMFLTCSKDNEPKLTNAENKVANLKIDLINENEEGIIAYNFRNIMNRYAKMYNELIDFAYNKPDEVNYKELLNVYDRLIGITSTTIEEKQKFLDNETISDEIFIRYLNDFIKELKRSKDRYVKTFKLRTKANNNWENAKNEYYYLFFAKEKDYLKRNCKALTKSCLNCHLKYKDIKTDLY